MISGLTFMQRERGRTSNSLYAGLYGRLIVGSNKCNQRGSHDKERWQREKSDREWNKKISIQGQIKALSEHPHTSSSSSFPKSQCQHLLRAQTPSSITSAGNPDPALCSLNPFIQNPAELLSLSRIKKGKLDFAGATRQPV